VPRSIGGERYREQARRMLRNLVDEHYNHPSIILWGLGNENDWPGDFPIFDKNGKIDDKGINQEGIKAFFTELNGLAHQLDPRGRR